jgi:hypothetical protein
MPISMDCGGSNVVRGLWPIERAVFEAAARDYPAAAESLRRQTEIAQVTNFRNTGEGFFSDISVPQDAPLLGTASPLDVGTGTVEAVEMGFLIFVKDGRAFLLEGYVFGVISTLHIDFERVSCEVKPWSEAGS